jgi:hypothetical protein
VYTINILSGAEISTIILGKNQTFLHSSYAGQTVRPTIDPHTIGYKSGTKFTIVPIHD